MRLLCCLLLSTFLFSNILSAQTGIYTDSTKNEAISSVISDTLAITIDVNNRTNKINDLELTASVIGGTPPYTYKWSNQSTPLTSSKASELTEGERYSLTVTDAINQSKTIEKKVDAVSNDERINAFFIPIVEFMNRFLMADIFAELGLYDSTIHDDNGNVMLHPNGDPRQMSIPFVVVWLILGAVFFYL